MAKKRKKRCGGFTLIELLIVIGIISIIAAVVIVALNPARQFAQARNAQRWSNINTILNATWQYAVDNKGNLPSTITTTQTEICKRGSASCTGLIDLSVLTTNEIYLVSIPEDPIGTSTDGVGYEIIRSANGRVTVYAPDAELGEAISATK